MKGESRIYEKIKTYKNRYKIKISNNCTKTPCNSTKRRTNVLPMKKV